MSLEARYGVLDSLYIVDATDNGAGNDKWTSTTVQTYEVPAGEVWWFFGGTVTRDANETLVVDLHDPDDNVVKNLFTDGAGTGIDDYGVGSTWTQPIRMIEGWYVKITAGGAQGAGAKATCYISKVPAVP